MSVPKSADRRTDTAFQLCIVDYVVDMFVIHCLASLERSFKLLY